MDQDPSKCVLVVIVVHGGPGLVSHTEVFDGLCPLLKHCATTDTMKIVFYDQLGCGKSDKPSETSRYSIDSSVKELREVVANAVTRYDAHKIILFGHSWGGQIVLEFLVKQQESSFRDLRVCGCIVSNSPFNEETYQQRQREIRGTWPPDLKQMLEEEEDALALKDDVESLVYRTLIGTRETQITGSMKGWYCPSPSSTITLQSLL